MFLLLTLIIIELRGTQKIKILKINKKYISQITLLTNFSSTVMQNKICQLFWDDGNTCDMKFNFESKKHWFIYLHNINICLNIIKESQKFLYKKKMKIHYLSIEHFKIFWNFIYDPSFAHLVRLYKNSKNIGYFHNSWVFIFIKKKKYYF